jgi:hypothetical protein
VPATSLPIAFVSAITAAFDAEYAAAIGLPSLPAIEETLTIRPYPRSIMLGSTARLQKKTPSALIAMTRLHSSSGTSIVESDAPGMPAEQTSTSMWPSSSRTAATASSTSAERETSPASPKTPSGAFDSRSREATRAPSSSRRRATAAPMPLAPPVTSATLPENRSALLMSPGEA